MLRVLLTLQMISFFDEFFWSNSVNFKSDRIWILRLLYCGLNLEDDARIYVRSSILEKLLSFYSSSLSDNESNYLILQVNYYIILSTKLCFIFNSMVALYYNISDADCEEVYEIR